jgi:hypothetical protein
MASLREVKNRVGHGSVRRAMAKLAMTRLTGFEPRRAIREAAHLTLKTDLAWRVTAWVFAMSTNIGYSVPSASSLTFAIAACTSAASRTVPRLPQKVENSLGIEFHSALAALNSDWFHLLLPQHLVELRLSGVPFPWKGYALTLWARLSDT